MTTAPTGSTMNKRSLLFFFMQRSALAALLAGLSGAGFALDLVASYEHALRADPTMRAADQAVLAGREKAVQGDALLKPQVSLSASLTRVSEKSTVSTATGSSQTDASGNVRQLAVQLVQPLYDAKASADKKQLYQQTALAEVGWRDAQQDLVRRVAEAYFNVLLARETLRVAQAEKTAVAMQRDRAQARFDVGRGRITDLQEAQARYDTVLAREVSAQSTLAEQELGAAQRDARLQVQDAFLAVKTGVARIGALEQSVLSARTALEATTLGRDLGTRTELDVLDAQQRLYTAELDLAQAKNDYLLGRVRLASAAGELREDDLRALNGYLVR